MGSWCWEDVLAKADFWTLYCKSSESINDTDLRRELFFTGMLDAIRDRRHVHWSFVCSSAAPWLRRVHRAPRAALARRARVAGGSRHRGSRRPTARPLLCEPARRLAASTGSGKEGRWTVIAAPDAPSGPHVLAQLDADPTDSRFPVAVVDASSFEDVELSVSCKPISGRVDQGCGLVWRYRDANNYYLTRANALEDNVRLYYVKGGQRHQLASWSGKVASSVWHKLRVHARGDHIVWTKADSVIQFDELEATAASP